MVIRRQIQWCLCSFPQSESAPFTQANESYTSELVITGTLVTTKLCRKGILSQDCILLKNESILSGLRRHWCLCSFPQSNILLKNESILSGLRGHWCLCSFPQSNILLKNESILSGLRGHWCLCTFPQSNSLLKNESILSGLRGHWSSGKQLPDIAA